MIKDLQLPKGKQETVTMHYLLSYSRLVKALNPTAALALKRLQMLLNRAADSRLAKLKESSRTELPRQTGNSAETFSTIIKVFPPSNLTYEHDLQNRRKDVKQQTDFDSLPAFHRSYYSTLHGLNHLPI